jgi:hypothetical protein
LQASNLASQERLDIARELDPVIRNIFADDTAAPDAWESASHTERASRRAKSNVQPAQPATATAQ